MAEAGLTRRVVSLNIHGAEGTDWFKEQFEFLRFTRHPAFQIEVLDSSNRSVRRITHHLCYNRIKPSKLRRTTHLHHSNVWGSQEDKEQQQNSEECRPVLPPDREELRVNTLPDEARNLINFFILVKDLVECDGGDCRVVDDGFSV